MAKDILKEAIADAKAVREVALANAKAALEEAFTPKLQSMLSAKLSEELDENTEELDENTEELDEMMYDEDKEDMDEAMYDEDKEDIDEVNLDEEIDLEEILNELELEEAKEADEKPVDEAKKADEDKVDEAKKADEDKVEEAKKDDENTVDEAKDDKEEKLDENRPVYKAEEANYAGYSADRVHEGEEFDLDALLEEINNLDEKKEEDEVNEAEEPVEEAKEETNEAVGAGLAGIAGLIAAAGGMAKLKMMFQDPEVQAKYPTANNVLNALEDAGTAAGDAMRRENEEMFEELEQTKNALETVKGELNEVNLLNSKLLYVNRIFKANTLDEAQKLRVVETLDKAGTTKEAKLIYETIKDTFNVAKSKKASIKSKTKSLKEGLGMASKAAGTSTAPKKEIISESNDMITRFQKLANIKINE